MSKAIIEIVRFQTDRGLHLKDFHTVNENANIVEELLEASALDVEKKDRPFLKKAWERFVGDVQRENIAIKVAEFSKGMVVDAYADVVVFAIGAIRKLGYDPEKVLLEVGKEINSREGSMVDGKFEKDLSDEAKAKWYKADYDNCKV